MLPENINQSPYPCTLAAAPNADFWHKVLSKAQLPLNSIEAVLGDSASEYDTDEMFMRGVFRRADGQEIRIEVTYSPSWDSIESAEVTEQPIG